MIREALAEIRRARRRTRFDYAGKVIVVTGGAGGIGSAFARRAATAGATLVIVDLDEARATALVDDLPPGGTPGHLSIRADLTDRTLRALRSLQATDTGLPLLTEFALQALQTAQALLARLADDPALALRAVLSDAGIRSTIRFPAPHRADLLVFPEDADRARTLAAGFQTTD